MKSKQIKIYLIVSLIILLITGCGEAATPTPVPTNTPLPYLEVGEVTEPLRILNDTDSSVFAHEKRVDTGDNFLKNFYERPFDQQMVYQPDINILAVSIAEDENFFYFTFVLEDLDPTTNTLTGTYGIEFDRTKTGRGDLLVNVHNPSKKWSVENIIVNSDPDGNVGGNKPIEAESGFEGQGYEGSVEMEDDVVAYARLVPDEPTQLQIAISRELLDNPLEFLWGAWADRGLKDPLLFDYNDHFGMSEAGSPILGNEDYPLGALYSVDNTCRLPYGFQQAGDIPGMCKTGTRTPSQPTDKITCPPGCFLIGDHCECIE